ncbi:extracellular solute-binding protein family 1 [Streptomyces lincolnensis]|uniref:Extracellular solute-binding protein family 1 n=1 Tax=Streptomyces lincolnensis TaxID=1915 RepID=A0A1B1M512_STRLN|nr:ABC transporter substrate-binding protein [Streptomyces lincolnensis]ANS63574.1 extracellular solute-binding protein family 1 [Streptomyces lincolnensis]AXG52496.1 extracellular solute-binding protein family 1 [Streptomyces lincolnensis]QMV05450.1 extracellular solute-binding protein [Streptomyces lincolnensis]
MHSSSRRLLAAVAVSTVVAVVGTACSSGSGSSGAKGADSGTFTVWDPYPQFTKDSAWTKLLDDCGGKAGVKIKRTGYDTSDLANKTLLAAQQGNSPDVLVVDNPVVSTLAEAGVLTTTDDNKLDTSKVDPNLLAAGQSDGKTYGTPIGANTLALYYNKSVLKEAGVDIASVKDWPSLTAALEKVKKAGKKGITFSAIGTEEGSFQFLPWFWGADAELTRLDSDQAVSALSLWKGWLDKGYAPNSVLNNTQTTSWQEFAGGDFAFAENGTWQLAGAEKAGFEYGVLPVPAAAGGSAAAPTGGEFVTLPVQDDTDRYTTSQKLATCLTSTQNLYDTDTTLSYVAPTTEVQDKQVAANAALQPWVEAVKKAKGRTSDNLGTQYPKISEQLWKAVQSALSGSKSPKDALTSAQDAAK